MSKITVYHFRKYDINSNQYVNFFDKRMATLEYINNLGEGFSPILETAKEVYKSEVDSNGRYPKIKS